MKRFFLMVALLVAGSCISMAANAADVSGSALNPESAVQPESAPIESSTPVTPQGTVRGIYWWAEPDPAALGSLGDFKIDVVAFRLGRLIFDSASSGIAWKDGLDVSKLTGFPAEIRFRPIVETDARFWNAVTPDDVRSFFRTNIGPALQQAGMSLSAIEVKVDDDVSSVAAPLDQFLTSVQTDGLPAPVVLGAEANSLAGLPESGDGAPFRNIPGIVVYFTEQDMSGISPRIADRAWVDAASARLNALGTPFIIVVPVYSRALVYRGRGEPTVVPSIDREKLTAVSDVRAMGAAGTEYVLKSDLADSPLKAGDRVLVLESLKQLDIKKLFEELPSLAPKLAEVDLFRFPLVPGFDPAPAEVLAQVGWTGQAPAVAPTGAPANGKSPDKQKYDRGQQFIMIATFVLMFLLMLRLMGKGKHGKTAGGGTGDAGGK